MITKKDILKMVHRVTRRSGGYAEKKLIAPHREWFIGMSLFLVIVGVGGFFNAQAYVRYDTIESTVVNTTRSIKQYDEITAQTAKEIYEQRMISFETLMKDEPAFIENIATTTTTTTTTTSVSDEVADSDEEVIDIVDEEFISVE
ncbi:hypothetical protein N8083_00755 [Candidatus Pacebacteria bacterium]|nr:hypothetical protein [Candidatus Paceibacterota bacterium]